MREVELASLFFIADRRPCCTYRNLSCEWYAPDAEDRVFHSSPIVECRRARDAGSLAALAVRGRKPRIRERLESGRLLRTGFFSKPLVGPDADPFLLWRARLERKVNRCKGSII